MVEKVILLL